jgi:hypothetical protein
MHRPLWRTESVKWFERVHPLLVAAGVDAVIAGHFHSLQDDGARDGVRYAIVGTCGGSIDQHPLAGQMQHLTFVQVAPDGALDMFHQPAGVTLPLDFVVREDQDRVHALRERPGSLKDAGALADPADATAPLEGRTRVEITNPLDREIEVLCRPWTSGETWIVEGELFASRTSIDAFNPFTMHANTAYRLLAPATPVRVAARGSATVELQWNWPRATGPVPPPTFCVEERFTDSKGRRVPVFQWLRPAVQRVVTADGTPWPLHAWKPSPYDTLEPDPVARIWREPDGRLLVRVEVADPVQSRAPQDTRPMERRARDPGGDAFKVTWTDPAGDGWALVEPFTPLAAASDPSRTPEVRSGRTDSGGWWAEARVSMPRGLPTRINVGVADNDETYHTQWRWLAPAEWPADLRAPSAP